MTTSINWLAFNSIHDMSAKSLTVGEVKTLTEDEIELLNKELEKAHKAMCSAREVIYSASVRFGK